MDTNTEFCIIWCGILYCINDLMLFQEKGTVIWKFRRNIDNRATEKLYVWVYGVVWLKPICHSWNTQHGRFHGGTLGKKVLSELLNYHNKVRMLIFCPVSLPLHTNHSSNWWKCWYFSSSTAHHSSTQEGRLPICSRCHMARHWWSRKC